MWCIGYESVIAYFVVKWEKYGYKKDKIRKHSGGIHKKGRENV